MGRNRYSLSAILCAQSEHAGGLECVDTATRLCFSHWEAAYLEFDDVIETLPSGNTSLTTVAQARQTP